MYSMVSTTVVECPYVVSSKNEKHPLQKPKVGDYVDLFLLVVVTACVRIMSTNNELKAFDSLYDLLRRSLTTADVIGECFANHIISTSERDAVEAAGTAGEKAAVLLDAVRRAIDISPANFGTFLTILSKEAKYTSLVEQLREFLYYYKCFKDLASFENVGDKVQKPPSAEQRPHVTG